MKIKDLNKEGENHIENYKINSKWNKDIGMFFYIAILVLMGVHIQKCKVLKKIVRRILEN